MNESKIYAAVSSITDELRKIGINKEKRASGGKIAYAYRSIEDVYAALSPLLPKFKIIIAPVRIEKESDGMAGSMRLVRIKVTYQVTSVEDGSHFCVESLGEGADTGDKAAGKAMSYAYKSLMFQLFCIPVQGVEDSDATESPDAHSAKPFISDELSEKSRTAANAGKEEWTKFWKSCTRDEREILQKTGEVDMAKKIIEAMAGSLS